MRKQAVYMVVARAMTKVGANILNPSHVLDRVSPRVFGGPLLGWINVLEAHVKLGLELPVNLKFCFEGVSHKSEGSSNDVTLT